ncbi:LuxR C-terminal-related transcriptional regulator [Marinobacter sp. chi1]|uniref:LuxR C-terminal-related transcriptional regulator n=1 Tax=Marinobacter suaedae TaxID=3057675 RepID=A0ABT8VWJ3_9GAMM|nr:LuxR C-terminal-related transcriptional regulator [Marinobacter sp. chi1]MDO3720351.1 LuxR C-terminal-related transcriptional regulator [Marinobacter sp. chi1]
MKPFNDGCAANDEFQSANNGLQKGELVKDLLRQRIQFPALPEGWLDRPQLEQSIAAALRPRSVILIEGGCGFGKTHLVARAIDTHRSAQDDCCWITLNGQDNSPSRFLTLLAIALNLSETLESALHSGGTFSDVLAMLLVSLERKSGKDEPKTLVLDNVQSLANPSVTALLHQLVADLPRCLCAVLISRSALPFETHNLELENRFVRFGVDSFAFSRSETFEFFARLLASERLTSVAVDQLYEVSEGWPAPLALYRREIACSENRQSLLDSASVQRFLKESVLGHLTRLQQRSLQLMAELELSSDSLFSSGEFPDFPVDFLPSQAADIGIPLRAVPGRGRWYRLNGLLKEWLKTPQVPGQKARLRYVSQWFGERDQFPESLKYALLSGDSKLVIEIASEGSEALLLGQDTASLLQLRKALPQHLLESSPRLRIVYSWVHAIGGQFSRARALINGLNEVDRASYSARLCALEAFILRGEGRIGSALDMADRALSQDELSAQARLVTQMVRSSALSACGRFAEAREANRIAAKLAREAGDYGSEALSVYGHAGIELGKGALKHAEQLLRTGLDTAMHELTRYARIGETRLQLSLALVLWHQGRDREADCLLASCSRQAEQSRDVGLLMAMALRVLMCRAAGQYEEAFAWVGRAERTMHAWQVDEAFFEPVLEALKASCWLAQGQLESARQALEKLEPHRSAGRIPELFPMMPGLLDCLQVRVDMAQGVAEGAREKLSNIRHRYGERMPSGVAIHVRLLDALLAEDGCDQKILQSVVESAAEEHFVSPFVEMAHELRPLMEKVFPRLEESAFTLALGRVFDLQVAPAHRDVLPEPISDREHGVLELIAKGLSNQEIADELHISLHTVKTHARRINAKLDVKSRTQAIVRARELGLL